MRVFYFLVLLLISILPVYLICLYVYKKDDKKEPSKLLRKLFIFGMLSCIPAAILEIILEPFFGVEENRNLIVWFIYATSSIALVEELFKWLVVYKISYSHKAFDQVYDAIVYAVFVSLGFACLENILYVLDSGIKVGLFRALTAIPGHAYDAIIMGNYLGLAKIADINNNSKLFKKNLLLSILLPTLAHGIYDYCLFSENYILVGIFFVFIVFIYIHSIKKIKLVSSLRKNIFNDKMTFNSEYISICHNCGTHSNGNFCTSCGTKLHINKLNSDNT